MNRHRIGKIVMLLASLLIPSGFAFGQTFEEAFPAEATKIWPIAWDASITS